MTNLHLTRRDAITSLLAISATAALASCKQSVGDGGTAEVSIGYASGESFFSAAEMATIVGLANTIIPDTDTPGAVAAGVPDVIQTLASEWGDDNYRKYMRGGLATLDDLFRKDAGQSFAALSPARQENLLGKYDAKAYADDASEEFEFYKNLKRTVATAYYMSEPGATQELAYEPVPGEWLGVVPLADYPKTWAT